MKPTHNDIYEKLSTMFSLKFKAQLKDSPIEFSNFLLVKNVVTEHENYVIVFQNEKEVVKFRNREEFILNFMNFIAIKLEGLEKEFNDLQNFEKTHLGIQYDKHEVYERHEYIGHASIKLNQIKNKLMTFKG